MNSEPLSQNLAFLCSYYPSIAAVCRRLQINRQQFNKYLSGQTWPSRRNMRKICDFFGVSEGELLMEHQRFAEIVGLRRRPLPIQPTDVMAHVEQLYQHSGDLGRYVGYYFRYFYSFGYAGKIIKCLVIIYEKDGRYFWRCLERLATVGKQGVKTTKYAAALLLLGDRIFALEYETFLKSSVTEVILYKSYHPSVAYLIGVQTGMPLLRGRRPAASLVLLEYLGKSVDQKKALRACGLFNEDDSAIDPSIRSLITNRIPEGTFVLETEEI
ncbi:helix-turn-helix transcriptional regulator [Mesorhizobium sp. B4-1-3]|uniref:helix-turn-helix domain-containing protein n=1 Tax=Mesorhizobium sp. B4-1-3 TaxID=2589889 RepID=UPI0015E2A642|nr:helix-turn-helix transcriptional regulator [Mesorhizobium sp. B4-1-3]